MSEVNDVWDQQSFDDLVELALLVGITNDEMESLLVEVDEDVNRFKSELALWIADAIVEMGYDGDESYEHMYWFAKGQQVKKEQEAAEKEAIDDLNHLNESC